MWVGFSSGINLQELRPRAESCRAVGAPAAWVAHPRGVGTRQTLALCLALVLNFSSGGFLSEILAGGWPKYVALSP